MKHATGRYSPPGISVRIVRSAKPDVPIRRRGRRAVRWLDRLSRLTPKRCSAAFDRETALGPPNELSSSQQELSHYRGDCRCSLDPDGNCELERLQRAGLDPACLPLPYLLPGWDRVGTAPEVIIIRIVE